MNYDDLLFEEQVQRELDLRALGNLDNAADTLGCVLVTVDEDAEPAEV